MTEGERLKDFLNAMLTEHTQNDTIQSLSYKPFGSLSHAFETLVSWTDKFKLDYISDKLRKSAWTYAWPDPDVTPSVPEPSPAP